MCYLSYNYTLTPRKHERRYVATLNANFEIKYRLIFNPKSLMCYLSINHTLTSIFPVYLSTKFIEIQFKCSLWPYKNSFVREINFRLYLKAFFMHINDELRRNLCFKNIKYAKNNQFTK